MTIKIQNLKGDSKITEAFTKKEWELVHVEHFGVNLDWDYWKIRRLSLKASEAGKVVGALGGELQGGVLHIAELIVDHNLRGKGIGEKLLKEAEKWTKENGGHEVHLETGKDWEAVKFYKRMGYELVAQLPNFFSKVDFVLFRKILD